MKPNFDDSPAIPLWLLLSAAATMLTGLYLIFVWVSTEVTMGLIQRIFYFHVPAATAAFCAVFTGGVASLLYLWKREARYDDLALAANELVIAFSAINIVMGSIWGRRTWGIWWTWDARLTSSLLLVLIYIGYLAIRKATPPEHRGSIGAVFCFFGMADVPLIYISNRLFRTQHPAPVIGGGENSGLDPDMLVTFLVMNAAMLLFWVCIVRVRRRVSGLERKLELLSRMTHESGARGV
jgi:heme exporter protein C